MDHKTYITNKSFCPLPWAGVYIDTQGTVQNCCISSEPIGSLIEKNIQDILNDDLNNKIKTKMLENRSPSSCNRCYSLEKDKSNNNINSNRIYYLKELKTIPFTLYESSNTFNLYHVDLRWQNSCNFACVYCGPTYSSTWEHELQVKLDHPDPRRLQETKDYIFSNITQLKNIYLAGGEPLLMTENYELLELLLEKNPDVDIRVNTNLSKTGTKIFNLLCHFKNVHWIVSVDSLHEEFEYIRYGSKWEDFLTNLEKISNLEHKLTFNMVWCLLNYKSIFDCIEFFQNKGYHNNSFIISCLTTPNWLDTRHLPDNVLQLIKSIAQSKIDQQPGFLLEDGYVNIIKHINTSFVKDLENSFTEIRKIDQRRKLDSTKIFSELYNIYQGK